MTMNEMNDPRVQELMELYAKLTDDQKAEAYAICVAVTRAGRHSLMIRDDGQGRYYLIDPVTNSLAAPEPAMTIEEVSLWLDDLDKAEGAV